MVSPLLYEINTRVWLRELSERAGERITLAEVPDSEILRWKQAGFTHVWLMGIWQVGPGSRRRALEHWRAVWRREIESSEQDVQGSPFAIQEYSVDERLGNALSLLLLKDRVSRHGLKLILDFVPNHVGMDSPEPLRYPARFVQAQSALPGTIELQTSLGKRFFAYGRDPHFPPWTDTIQCDHRILETQQALTAVAQTASMYGHGLRCDMAMLLLPEVFEQTWKNFPPAGQHQVGTNFWKRAIPAVQQLHPEAVLIAEVYWDREGELQDLGFDFTYNKRITDFLLGGELRHLSEFISRRPLDYFRRSVHFLENHDEARVASRLPLALHKAAAALILFLPGMALLHDGQLEGRRKFAHIQMSRRADEPVNEDISRYYTALLSSIAATHVRRGKPLFVHADPSRPGVIAVGWQGREPELDLALVNLAPQEDEYLFNAPVLSRPVNLTEVRLLFTTGNNDPAVHRQEDSILVRLPPQSACIARLGEAGVKS